MTKPFADSPHEWVLADSAEHVFTNHLVRALLMRGDGQLVHEALAEAHKSHPGEEAEGLAHELEAIRQRIEPKENSDVR